MIDPWIETVTGIRFEFLNPTSDMISIEDIAHALSMTCRYSGHVQKFYSVAEHSVLCSHLVPQSHALAALMHDASEAYITDVASPVKQYLVNYKEMEDIIMNAIAVKYNFQYPLSEEVKYVDLVMLSKEAFTLLPSQGHTWNMWDYIKRPDLDCGLVPACLSPDDAKKAFMTRFAELTTGTGDDR